ncbi:chymase-like [Oryctolagus cuniculus]|uniref:chymase-like n=1 Tax=Oryctolagus cuniculus TaxID=9986 RepID=UPI0038796AF1
MLLKLKEKANLTLTVGTLPLLPQSNFIPPGRMCRAAGWGKTSVKESHSNVLQEVKLRLLDPPACQHFPDFNHNLQLCMGKQCVQGRLWGPLLCAGVAQGIASYAHKNAMPPSVFTRISYYWPWINKVLKEN